VSKSHLPKRSTPTMSALSVAAGFPCSRSCWHTLHSAPAAKDGLSILSTASCRQPLADTRSSTASRRQPLVDSLSPTLARRQPLVDSLLSTASRRHSLVDSLQRLVNSNVADERRPGSRHHRPAHRSMKAKTGRARARRHNTAANGTAAFAARDGNAKDLLTIAIEITRPIDIELQEMRKTAIWCRPVR
jgi:hypothetical protein